VIWVISPVAAIVGLLLSKNQIGPLVLVLVGVVSGIISGRISKTGGEEQK